MKIIQFPSVPRNENLGVTDLAKETPSLLIQYRDGAGGEFLVWAICVICAVASIVLCVSQLQNDVSRVQRAHVDRISVNRLADEIPYAVEVSKRL